MEKDIYGMHLIRNTQEGMPTREARRKSCRRRQKRLQARVGLFSAGLREAVVVLVLYTMTTNINICYYYYYYYYDYYCYYYY